MEKLLTLKNEMLEALKFAAEEVNSIWSLGTLSVPDNLCMGDKTIKRKDFVFRKMYSAIGRVLTAHNYKFAIQSDRSLRVFLGKNKRAVVYVKLCPLTVEMEEQPQVWQELKF